MRPPSEVTIASRPSATGTPTTTISASHAGHQPVPPRRPRPQQHDERDDTGDQRRSGQLERQHRATDAPEHLRVPTGRRVAGTVDQLDVDVHDASTSATGAPVCWMSSPPRSRTQSELTIIHITNPPAMNTPRAERNDRRNDADGERRGEPHHGGHRDDEHLGLVGEADEDVEHAQLPLLVDDGSAVAAGTAGSGAVGVPTALTSHRPSRRVSSRS